MIMYMTVINIVLAVGLAVATAWNVIEANRHRDFRMRHDQEIERLQEQTRSMEEDSRAGRELNERLERMVEAWKVKFETLDAQRRELDTAMEQFQIAKELFDKKCLAQKVRISEKEIISEISRRAGK